MIKFSFDVNKYKFKEMVSDLFEVDNLEKIHEHNPELVKDDYRKLNIHNENTTDFQDKFIKPNDNWTELYDRYDKFIHDEINLYLMRNFTINIYRLSEFIFSKTTHPYTLKILIQTHYTNIL